MPIGPTIPEEVVGKVQVLAGMVLSPHSARFWKEENLERRQQLASRGESVLRSVRGVSSCLWPVIGGD